MVLVICGLVRGPVLGCTALQAAGQWLEGLLFCCCDGNPVVALVARAERHFLRDFLTTSPCATAMPPIYHHSRDSHLRATSSAARQRA